MATGVLHEEHVLLGASFEESAVTGGPLVLAYAGEKNLDELLPGAVLSDLTGSAYLLVSGASSQALFSAVPNPNPDEKTERIILTGDIPSPANPPMGCKFHTRCPKAKEICSHIAPVYKEYEEGHFVACHCYPQED